MPGVHTFYDGATFLQPIAKHYGVQVDKINFVLCMFSSLFLAYVYKRFMAPGAVSRQMRVLFPPLIGISFCFFCFGRASKHLLANCLLNYAIMYFAPPKHVHRLVFAFCMCYLLFIHFYRWLILTSYYLDITGPMMVAVQKITTVAFSLHDGRVKKKEELTELQKREAIVELPSLSEYVSFIFNFQTALTGPVNFYSDYLAFIDGVHVVRTKDGKEPSAVGASMRKLAESILYLLIIAQFGATYPPELIAEKEYLALPYLQWFMWWFIVIFLIRVNYYFAWTFADSVCNMSGFGFSGYDENGNAKWELCTNVRPYQVEMAQSFKETLDGWNIQTGGWLRRVAYDRTPKKIRTFATYALSAMWHGISVGYYMTFFTGALFTLAGATFRRCMRHRFLDCHKKKLAYDVMTFMATKVALAYATYPFVTMNLNPAFSLYKRVYFFVHIAAILILVVLPRVYPPPPRVSSANANSSLKSDLPPPPEVKKDL
ncbi:MBOAT family protein [Ancylostoma caninum]|nr:MBOAT family protein [Ancylostoma caninum]